VARKQPVRGQLTPADKAALRGMARRVGGRAELLRQVKAVFHRKRGRPKGTAQYGHDPDFLRIVEVIYRVANRDRGMQRQAVIGWLFDDVGVKKVFGASRAAFVKRLASKMKSSGVTKATLDISRLRLSPDGSCSVGVFGGIKSAQN
jgi:hypothetical protein